MLFVNDYAETYCERFRILKFIKIITLKQWKRWSWTVKRVVVVGLNHICGNKKYSLHIVNVVVFFVGFKMD